jgi:hypothetical protein
VSIVPGQIDEPAGLPSVVPKATGIGGTGEVERLAPPPKDRSGRSCQSMEIGGMEYALK